MSSSSVTTSIAERKRPLCYLFGLSWKRRFADLGELSSQCQNLVFSRLLFIGGRPSIRRAFGSYVDAARHFPA
jgi:hypothetical protein